MRSDLAVVLLILALGGCAAYEVAVWRECLDNNSLLYCMRILSR